MHRNKMKRVQQFLFKKFAPYLKISKDFTEVSMILKDFMRISYKFNKNIAKILQKCQKTPKKFLLPVYKESNIFPSQDRRELCNPS